MFQLSPEETAHTQALNNLIAEEIDKNKGITFARFMELALYAPKLGYYRSTQPKFGREGDFVTAPEISSLFGACLAEQCKAIGAQLPRFQILELGAGSGKLAFDLLTSLAKENALPEKYFILEVSGFLQLEQKNRIETLPPELASRVEWISTLPENFTGVVLANEVMDAMPVHRFCMDENGPQEYYVSLDKNGFIWQLGAPSLPELGTAISDLHLKPYPYNSEINWFIPNWIKSLGDCLKQGVILLIDYGFPRHEYYHPDRTMGTLMCHFRHHAHSEPLLLAGLQDITTHVDFTAVAESAEAAELSVLGFTNQAAFLLNCGLLNSLNESMVNNPEKEHLLTQQVKILTLPSEMGELFKVIALGKDFNEALTGFATQDQRHRL